MKTFSIFPFKKDDISKIDKRLIPFIQGWSITQKYNGQTVVIPGTWDSEITIVKYFQVIKDKDDPNPGEEENEIGLRIEAGWWPYDTEVIIELRISGKDVLDGTNNIHTEIYKAGGTSMKVYHNGKFLTNFTKKMGWWNVKTDKVWIKLD